MHAYSVGYAQKVVLSDAFIRIRTKQTAPQNLECFVFDYSPTNGRISQIEQLDRYKHITELSLVGHKFVDIRNLSVLVCLRKLNLAWNAIRNVKPLTKLVALESLNLGHNAISGLPVEIENLVRLKVLNLGFNRIVERDEVRRLKRNEELENVEFDGNTFLNDDDGLLFVVFSLPQVSVLNRKRVSREMRIQATQRFASSSLDVDSNGGGFRIHLEDRKNAIEFSDEISGRSSGIGRVFSHAMSAGSEDDIARMNEMKKKLAGLKQKEKQAGKNHEKQMGMKQATARRMAESPVKRASPKHVAEIQLQKAKKENRRLVGRMHELEEDTEYHVSQIKSQQRELRELKKEQYEDDNGKVRKLQKELEVQRVEYEKKIKSLRAQCESSDAVISQLRSENNDLRFVKSELTSSFQQITEGRSELAAEADERVRNLEELVAQRSEVIQSLREELHVKDKAIEEMKSEIDFGDLKPSLSESSWGAEMSKTEVIKTLSSMEQEYSELSRESRKQTDQIKKLKREIGILKHKLDESGKMCAQLLDANNRSKQLVEAASNALSTKDRMIEQLKAERAGFLSKMSHEIQTRDTRIEELEQNLEEVSFFSKPYAVGNVQDSEQTIDSEKIADNQEDEDDLEIEKSAVATVGDPLTLGIGQNYQDSEDQEIVYTHIQRGFVIA